MGYLYKLPGRAWTRGTGTPGAERVRIEARVRKTSALLEATQIARFEAGEEIYIPGLEGMAGIWLRKAKVGD